MRQVLPSNVALTFDGAQFRKEKSKIQENGFPANISEPELQTRSNFLLPGSHHEEKVVKLMEDPDRQPWPGQSRSKTKAAQKEVKPIT